MKMQRELKLTVTIEDASGKTDLEKLASDLGSKLLRVVDDELFDLVGLDAPGVNYWGAHVVYDCDPS